MTDTTVKHTTAYVAVMEYNIAQLTAMIAEARANVEAAWKVANNHTTDEGYTTEVWREYAVQAIEAERIYAHLYSMLEEKYRMARHLESRQAEQEYAEPEPGDPNYCQG
jgi:hypothetical protein